MAKKDELKLKREADRRTALLGLAADRNSEKQRECLTSMEMSNLLDGRCSDSQRQSFIAHLSSCDTCYREWLELEQELSGDTAHYKKLLFFRQKYLTVAGSLLAAAASIIFYLNLDQSPGLQEATIQPMPQLESVQSLDAQERPVRQKKVEKSAPSVSVKKTERMRVEIQSDSVKENKVDEFSARMAAPVAVAPEPVQLWLERVQQSCSEPGGGHEKWSLLFMQGRELSSAEESPHLLNVVKLVGKLAQGQDQELVCRKIMKIIHERKE